LTAVYGAVFAMVTAVVLGGVYVQSVAYLTRRVDTILIAHADALTRAPPDELEADIGEALRLNDDRINVFALFSPDGAWITGNLRKPPAGLRTNRRPVEIGPTTGFPAPARVIARRLGSGDVLVVGRDVNQLREIRAIIASALAWSGALIVFVGLACGIGLSIPPLRRLHALQAAAQAIADGDLKRRMPAGRGHDELDRFAAAVNTMMEEVERLMWEVKSATETIAHDLRTPLTRARARLHRLGQAGAWRTEDISRVTSEIDEVLDRFRAILRIAELEARERRAGFTGASLGGILGEVADLYEPLAELGGVTLSVSAAADVVIDGDPKLLFEAVSNLVDNAIKFTPRGGAVRLGLEADSAGPRLFVQDTGPGIPPGERAAVLRRFHRAQRDRVTPGLGLGLSVVAVIVRLHGLELALEDANPGLRAVIRPPAAA
jgi:signal transduction histidine kinase